MSGGEIFLREIYEQPAALRALLAAEAEVSEVGARIAERRRLVRLVAHGSSDNAASYAVYAFGLLAGWNAMRDSISLSVYYDAELPFEDALVVALSQSGRTPDVVEYVERARRRGALTVALTNDDDSPLAEAAELVVTVHAGRERREVSAGLGVVADQAEEALPRLEREVARLATSFAFIGRMVVIGRGVEYATAREVALKLMETCRVAAEALTATDLAHGPVAALDQLYPVWAIASEDASRPAVEAAVARAREVGALVVASGSAAGRLEGASHVLETPRAPLPILEPILSVLPGQLFASALARAKGLDPDEPAHLSKVTLAP